MRLFQGHLASECTRLIEKGVRLSVIGRRDRIPDSLYRRISQVEESTKKGDALHLRIAIDYSGRDSLVAAASRLVDAGPPSRQAFEEYLSQAIHAPKGTGDVDLLIRTGGEQRLSDFLLWESAYAELFFTEVLWPDFTEADLASAVQWYSARERRFGGLPSGPKNGRELSLPVGRAAP
jgi:undecaprenyl diphosphate synthase